MAILYFEGAGMTFEPHGHSDVGNYRIRTCFTNLDGVKFYFEASRTYKLQRNKIVSEWVLNIEHLILVDDEGEYPEIDRDYRDVAQYSYTREDITNWINENLNCDFDTIEVLDQFYGYIPINEDGTFNCIESHNADHDLAARRKAAFDQVDLEYRKLLKEKYSVIRLVGMNNEESITVKCHASDKALQAAGLPRVKKVTL
jgi:hypothetical protein